VSELFALEPNALARRLAAKRIAAAPFPVHLIETEAERIPLADASVDCATSTFTLCTIRDVDAALAEIRRVLRPGAPFFFLEHGRAPDARVARWQDRLDPLQRRLGGGCHLNREIDAIVSGAGFEFEKIERHYMRGAPRFAGFLYCGRALGPS
jgi:SAM-dependent methyltransferase